MAKGALPSTAGRRARATGSCLHGAATPLPGHGFKVGRRHRTGGGRARLLRRGLRRRLRQGVGCWLYSRVRVLGGGERRRMSAGGRRSSVGLRRRLQSRVRVLREKKRKTERSTGGGWIERERGRGGL